MHPVKISSFAVHSPRGAFFPAHFKAVISLNQACLPDLLKLFYEKYVCTYLSTNLCLSVQTDPREQILKW